MARFFARRVVNEDSEFVSPQLRRRSFYTSPSTDAGNFHRLGAPLRVRDSLLRQCRESRIGVGRDGDDDDDHSIDINDHPSKGSDESFDWSFDDDAER
jgi:hypothetical protein